VWRAERRGTLYPWAEFVVNQIELLLDEEGNLTHSRTS
jgi:hypothetical protein